MEFILTHKEETTGEDLYVTQIVARIEGKILVLEEREYKNQHVLSSEDLLKVHKENIDLLELQNLVNKLND